MEIRITQQAKRLRGGVRPPGDKSISHRALLLGGIAQGTSRIQGFLRAGVTDAMLGCLETLGVDAEFMDDDDLVIVGRPWQTPGETLDCQNSGATIRMLLGALAAQPIEATLDGTPRLRRRPMGRVVEPLRMMGADIQGADDQPPLKVRGGKLHGIDYELPVASAQVKTAILLAALFADGPTTIHEPGPSRDHTERMLRCLGIAVNASNGTAELIPEPGPLSAFSLLIPADISSAAFLIAAAALVPGSKLELPGVGINPTRTGLLEVLQEMGARIEIENEHQSGAEPIADLEIRGSELRGVRISGERVVRMIDEFPIFAVAATQAKGETIVSDAAELRLKESDRIASLVGELQKMGARIEAKADGFVVEGPTRLQGADVESHKDHRLAMALTIAGLIAEGTTVVHGAECIQQSYPDFISNLTSCGAELA
jgi:3-phosphoshikimate 1-carboxyvinyltransferase